LSDRLLVTTFPFGEPDPAPRELLAHAGIDYEVQPWKRRLTEGELARMAAPFSVLVAGTEPITAEVMDGAPRLRLISRVGIGLDSVDLLEARARGITVAYTPDAPSPAVAELTVGLMLDLARHVTDADRRLRAGAWSRLMGRRLDGATIGVVGAGRVGGRVLRILRGAFPGARLLAHDLRVDEQLSEATDVSWVEMDELLSTCDVVTVHVPLTGLTRRMIGARELGMMKHDAVLINTARGGIVDESDLASALRAGALAAAAVDVFEEEPYIGELRTLSNCLLTCHMGSMTADCRARMETEAVAEAIRLLRGEPLHQPVPETEYELRRNSK
jgi:D-3-phosphoglycerate dehydrogenase